MNVDSIKKIINWCRQEGILLLADEVYQENVWKKDSTFISFRKVAHDMNAFEGPNNLQLISFHSISKVRKSLLLLNIILHSLFIH